MYFTSQFSKQKSSTFNSPATPAHTGFGSSTRQGLCLMAASFLTTGLLASVSTSTAYANEAGAPSPAVNIPAPPPPGPAAGTAPDAAPSPTGSALSPPGTLLEATAAPHLLNPGGEHLPGSAQRIRYASINSNGEPVEVTGYVIDPITPWQGDGPTPTIVMAPGTRGAGDLCAPSAAPDLISGLEIQTNADGQPYLSVNANYELPLQYLANLAGIRIISTDYMGMGTPDHHTYVNSVEEAHAVLDAARAGLQAAGAPADSPVGFAGYSQGGGAAAAAAEHKASYAPELNLVGTFAGAPPADLRHVLEAVDNSSIVAALGYTLNGFVDRYPTLQRIIDEEFNEEGKRFLHDAEISCIGDATINWGFTDTRTLTKSGDSFSEVINRHAELRNLVEAQKLGTQPVSGPIMVSNSGDDDLIPFAQATTMARQYCAQGGQVQFLHTDVPPVLPELKAGVNHALPLFTDMPQGLQYLIDRFHGIAPRNDCGTF